MILDSGFLVSSSLVSNYIYIYNLHVVLCTVSLVAVADQATTNTATAIDHIHLPYKFILHTLYTRNFVDGNKFQRGCIYTIADKTKFFINYSLLFQLSFQLWRWMIIKTVSKMKICCCTSYLSSTLIL